MSLRHRHKKRQAEQFKVWDKLKDVRNQRQLQANWTVEQAQDMDAMHGIEAENELAAILANEIANEFK